MTKDELERLRHQLAHLSDYHVEEFYRKAWESCRPGNGVPAARAVQELVTAWKLLRKMAARPKYPAHRRHYR